MADAVNLPNSLASSLFLILFHKTLSSRSPQPCSSGHSIELIISKNHLPSKSEHPTLWSSPPILIVHRLQFSKFIETSWHRPYHFLLFNFHVPYPLHVLTSILPGLGSLGQPFPVVTIPFADSIIMSQFLSCPTCWENRLCCQSLCGFSPYMSEPEIVLLVCFRIYCVSIC